MTLYSISIIALLFLLNLFIFTHALFEYICDEKQLYKPYLHVYKARRGAREIDVGPGFHDVAEYMNAYVCINGPAYLYFSKNTEFGEVYEAAQLKMYAHTCEMYNVKPREGSASVTEVQLHLRAVLLLGDPVDYRRVSIQQFTAPYFFRKDQINPKVATDKDYVPIAPHYINATSLVIIGQSECTLTKGIKETLIKVRPFIQPAATPPASPGAKVAEKGWLCKIGYGALLEKASTPPGGPVPPIEDRAPALALINDEAIRVDRCVAIPTFDTDSATAEYDGAKQEIDNIDTEIDQKKADLKTEYDKLADAVITPLNDEMTKQSTKKSDPATKPKEIKRLEKQIKKLELRIKVEEEKKTEYDSALNELSAELANCKTLMDEAKPDGTKGSAAKTDKEATDTAKKEWEDAVTGNKPQTEIDTAKTAFEDAKKKAEESARVYQWELSDLNIAMLRLKKYAEKVKILGNYSPSPNTPRSSRSSSKHHVNLNAEGSMPIIINADEKDCVPLPVLEDECKNGKPQKDPTCNLFKSTLGTEDLWAAPTAAESMWKKEILQLIGDIFSTACDRISHVKKLVTLNNRVMGHYLTDDKIFNLKSDVLTDTCVNYKFSKSLVLGNTPGMLTSDLKYTEEKQFWYSIKIALKECKTQGRRLSFKEISLATKKYKFVKEPGTVSEQEFDVLRHKEQADEEYSYNWPIDMNWKMFVTVMGICMSGYEKKIPLITSRFFSLYTEYFLIPLRETWVNPKDNMVFQFIMGEFYNGDAEFWADMCMEASFVYAGQTDYRPPRSLLVNCASEHNYFLNGDFSKKVRDKFSKG